MGRQVSTETAGSRLRASLIQAATPLPPPGGCRLDWAKEDFFTTQGLSARLRSERSMSCRARLRVLPLLKSGQAESKQGVGALSAGQRLPVGWQLALYGGFLFQVAQLLQSLDEALIGDGFITYYGGCLTQSSTRSVYDQAPTARGGAGTGRGEGVPHNGQTQHGDCCTG